MNMTAALLIPVVLSFVVLAAHFLRGGNLLVVAVCLAFPLLLLARKWWIARIIQIALVLGAIEWFFTTMQIVHERQEDGRPWTRAGIIFGIVMLWTLGSALAFVHPALKRRYRC
jgi:hypothetical protein